MADESSETETQTNGTSGKNPSALDALHADWKKRTGGKKPDAKVIKAHKEALQKGLDKIAEGEKLMKQGQAEFDAATQEAMKAFGRTNVSMNNGIMLEPSCRGERLYYKRRSQEDAL